MTTELTVPVMIAAILLAALIKRVDIAEAFCEGAAEALLTSARLCPMLILLMTCVSMFLDSGASDRLSELLGPALGTLGFPSECVPLMMVRPVSGSAALSVLDSLLGSVPPDSLAGRTAAVMMGATETTLYTIAVYYSAVGERPGVRVFLCSFAADITGFILAPLAVRLFFGM